MRCRVAYWRTGLGLTVDEELHAALRARGKGVTVALLADRRLMVNSREHGGNRFGRLNVFCGRSAERAHKAVGFFADGEVPLDLSLAPPGAELPLFESHEVPVDYDYAMDAWVTAPLAPDHELPWPAYRANAQRMSAEELRHQCYLRCRSHMLVGGHGYFDEVGVPVQVVRTMSGGYAMALEKARTEVDAAAARAAA